MPSLSAYLYAARRMSPELLVAKTARRLGFGMGFVRRAELLNDPKAKNPTRLSELFDTLSRAAEQAGGVSFNMRGRQVLEIGSGPLGGLGPTAAVDGAVSYTGVDPGFNSTTFEHAAVVERFLKPALSAIARRRGQEPRNELLTQYRAISHYHRGGMEDLPFPASPYDLVLSISCLEHIADLDAALARLKAVTSPDCLSAHIVNFSNHVSKERPFDNLYSMEPDQYRMRLGKHINLLRPPDIERAFLDAGFNTRFIPLDRRPDVLPRSIDPWWTLRYSEETLAIRTGLILVGS